MYTYFTLNQHGPWVYSDDVVTWKERIRRNTAHTDSYVPHIRMIHVWPPLQN